MSDEVDVAIIGAGFGGLLTGARLRELGVGSIRLIDKAADVGGTWYWNRYPGIACDVESYVYMPLLEELGYVPTEKYAKGDEIFAHCRHIAEHYDLYRDICLQTEVHEIRWDPALSRWIISTNHGDAIRARFVAMANGYLQKPKLPGIEGIMAFGGHAFHTSRWDYDYTGTDLAKLSDKRVGHHRDRRDRDPVRSASGQIGEAAAGLPAHAVDRRRARQPADRSGVVGRRWTTGWQRRRIENFQLLTAGGDADEDLVDDAWTSIVKKLFVMRQTSIEGMSDEERLRAVELADFAKMEEIRGPRRLDRGRPRHRRGAQTLVRLLLQATVLPRRISADVQPRQRHPRRHPGHGRRAHHRRRRRRRRHRTPRRLPDLRDRIRGRHRLLAAYRVRARRPRRVDADRQVARRRSHLPRPHRPRLPELLHPEHRAVGFHRELPVPPRCPGDATSPR